MPKTCLTDFTGVLNAFNKASEFMAGPAQLEPLFLIRCMVVSLSGPGALQKLWCF